MEERTSPKKDHKTRAEEMQNNSLQLKHSKFKNCVAQPNRRSDVSSRGTTTASLPVSVTFDGSTNLTLVGSSKIEISSKLFPLFSSPSQKQNTHLPVVSLLLVGARDLMCDQFQP